MRKYDAPTDWQTAAQAYLQRLGLAEYSAQKEAHIKRGHSPKTFRHYPSDYHRGFGRPSRRQ